MFIEKAAVRRERTFCGCPSLSVALPVLQCLDGHYSFTLCVTPHGILHFSFIFNYGIYNYIKIYKIVYGVIYLYNFIKKIYIYFFFYFNSELLNFKKNYIYLYIYIYIYIYISKNIKTSDIGKQITKKKFFFQFSYRFLRVNIFSWKVFALFFFKINASLFWFLLYFAECCIYFRSTFRGMFSPSINIFMLLNTFSHPFPFLLIRQSNFSGSGQRL